MDTKLHSVIHESSGDEVVDGVIYYLMDIHTGNAADYGIFVSSEDGSTYEFSAFSDHE